MEKRQRQQAIRKLVRQHPISSQAELVERLEADGIAATQASVSRDMRELGLIKANGRYTTPGRLKPVAEEPGPEMIHSTQPVGANLVVVKTAIGAATQVALQIDQLQHSDIAGTIAGDDTIFVAVPSRAAQGRVLALLRRVPRT